MLDIEMVIKEINELLSGEKETLEYEFFNKHILQVQTHGKDLEFYYVTNAEKKRGMGTFGKFIRRDKVTDELLRKILNEINSILSVAKRKRIETDKCA